MEHKYKILVIIPAFNEEKSVATVIKNVQNKAPFADILIVDDGSIDSTALIAKKEGTSVISLPYRMGLGFAMKTGYKYALSENYDIVIKCDGDNQHPAYQIKNLIKPILNNKADYVVGSRFLNKFNNRPTFARMMGIKLYSRLFALMSQKNITDPTCGFCAFNKKAIRIFAFHYPNSYPEYESLVMAHQASLKIAEVPIRIRRRKNGKSSITFFGAFYYTLRVILKSIINSKFVKVC